MHLSATSRKEGAAMVESCLVIIMLCLILFGFLQVSHVIMSGNVLRYAALSTARAASVGLHDGMQDRVGMYASIPTAGSITTPSSASVNRMEKLTAGEKMDAALTRSRSPESSQGYYEVYVKSEFHMANESEYRAILDYNYWENNAGARVRIYTDSSDEMVGTTIRQFLPLTLPFSKVFGQHLGSSATVNGQTYPAFEMEFSAFMEDHASYYLDGAL